MSAGVDSIVDIDLVGDAPAISEEVDLVADAPVLDSLELIPWEELALPRETLRQTVRRLLSERERTRLEALHGPKFAKIRQEQETLLRKMGEPVEAVS
jgi:hypothetical protein